MGTLVLAGATSGSATLTPVDAVTAVITLPSATATLATLGANTFTGNQAITGTLSATGQVTSSGATNDVAFIAQDSGSVTGFKANNTGTGGRNYSMFSTANASGLGGGLFAIYDNTAGAARMTISTTGLAVTGTLSATGAITEIPRMAVYQWTNWSPSDVSGTTTNAPATATATSTATSYITMANSSGTVTFTFVKAGVYSINFVGGLATILAGLTVAKMALNYGGTATRFVGTSPRANQYHDDAFDHAFNTSVVATTNQTLTVLPAMSVTGAGVAANFAFYATVSAAYMGTP